MTPWDFFQMLTQRGIDQNVALKATQAFAEKTGQGPTVAAGPGPRDRGMGPRDPGPGPRSRGPGPPTKMPTMGGGPVGTQPGPGGLMPPPYAGPPPNVGPPQDPRWNAPMDRGMLGIPSAPLPSPGPRGAAPYFPPQDPRRSGAGAAKSRKKRR